MKWYIFFLGFSLLFSSCKKEELIPKDEAYNTSHTINWMQDLLKQYPGRDITLKDICLPRAHDAGVYELNNCTAGNACNTQTQYLPMSQMLASGVRVFDLRPVLINGVYWTFHRTNCGGLGCEGVLLRTFLEDTKNYLDAHNELVIFEITHLCNTSSQDPNLIALFNDVLGDTKYTLDSPLSNAFIRTPLSEIIPANGSSGKVVLLWEDVGSANEDASAGIFAYDFIPVSGTYANNKDIDIVIADQVQKMNAFNANSNRLFKFCYTFTLDVGAAATCLSEVENPLSIESIALDGRARLESTINTLIANGTISSAKIPNILSIDFANTTVSEPCIRLSNLSLQ